MRNPRYPGGGPPALERKPFCLGIPAARVTVLDTLGRKRNLVDYTGDEIDDASVAVCIAEAERLLQEASVRIGKAR